MTGKTCAVFLSNISLPTIWIEIRRPSYLSFANSSYRAFTRTPERSMNISRGQPNSSLCRQYFQRRSIASFVGAISLSLTYGLPVERTNDPSVNDMINCFRDLIEAGSIDNHLVNILPFLKYIPEWMPGAGFKSDARKIRAELDRLLDEPYNKVLKNMVCPPPNDLNEAQLIHMLGGGDGTDVFRFRECWEHQE